MRDAQVEILQMYAKGLVTAEQAERMLDALDQPEIRQLRSREPAGTGLDRQERRTVAS